MRKRIVSMMAALSAACGAYAVPTVKEVTLTHAPGTRNAAVISYTLEGGDAIVTVAVETNGVALPGGASARFSGDVFRRVQAGSRSIAWEVSEEWPAQLVSNVSVKVTAWAPHAPPPYLVVDLSAGPAAGAGEYPVRYYPDLACLPDGGLSNDLYRTERLVMRFIPAGTFYMGSLHFEPHRTAASETLHRVALTNSFYLGVYETTQRQWERVTGSNPAGFTLEGETRPVENVTYLQIREGSEAAELNWPATGYRVGNDSFMGRLRSRTGLNGFDLPTDAQWEYACKAGSWQGIGVFGGVPLTNANADANMDLAGRYLGNGGPSQYNASNKAVIPVSQATAKAGSYLPNAWGLYDMHGNVYEWALDWHAYDLGAEPVVEPVGPTGGTHRVVRGGSYHNTAELARSAHRNGGRVPEAETRWHTGFRVALLVR
jgi:formylglycine-generating enzyme required for sulfatase activity